MVITRGKAHADVESAQAKVAQAKAALEYAKANLKATPAFQQNLEALRAGVGAAQAGLDGARAKLDDAVLRAPLDGVVSARTQDPGGLASPSQPILTIQSLNAVWVTIGVPDTVCTRLRLGQPATVTFDALGGVKLTGRIAQINPSADAQNRQFTVRVAVDNAAKTIDPGMFAQVTIVTAQAKHVLVVPIEAVRTDDTLGSYVIIAKPGAPKGASGGAPGGGKPDGAPAAAPGGAPGGAPKIEISTAVFTPVVTGLTDETWTEVRVGLTPKDKVVTMSAMTVNDGQAIRAGGGRTRGEKPGMGKGAPGEKKPEGDAPAHGARKGTPAAGMHRRSGE